MQIVWVVTWSLSRVWIWILIYGIWQHCALGRNIMLLSKTKPNWSYVVLWYVHLKVVAAYMQRFVHNFRLYSCYGYFLSHLMHTRSTTCQHMHSKRIKLIVRIDIENMVLNHEWQSPYYIHTFGIRILIQIFYNHLFPWTTKYPR